MARLIDREQNKAAYKSVSKQNVNAVILEHHCHCMIEWGAHPYMERTSHTGSLTDKTVQAG